MEKILKQYETILKDANYEVIKTPKLGWIILRTDYQNYSDPIKQMHSPEELQKYIESQI